MKLTSTGSPGAFTQSAQAAPSSTSASPGAIAGNPNSAGGAEMQGVQDRRAGAFEGSSYSNPNVFPVTRFGDSPYKDQYCSSQGVARCGVNPSDPLLKSTDSDRV